MCYTQHMEEVWSLSNHLCFHEKAVVIINNRTKKLKWEEEAYILPHWFVLLERKVNGNVSYAEDFQKLFFFWVSFKKIMLEATCWVCGTGSVSITMAPEHSSKWLTSKANETEAESQQAVTSSSQTCQYISIWTFTPNRLPLSYHSPMLLQ